MRNSYSSRFHSTYLLRKVGAARTDHPAHLFPDRDDRVPADHQVERGVLEGQRAVVADLHDVHPERSKVAPGYLDVWRPGLGRCNEAGQMLRFPQYLGEYLSTTCLDI